MKSWNYLISLKSFVKVPEIVREEDTITEYKMDLETWLEARHILKDIWKAGFA
jgi:hypothetical protein